MTYLNKTLFKNIFQLYDCFEMKITRSLDSWSGGLSETETSILKAYRDLIQKAEHYIYIEVNI